MRSIVIENTNIKVSRLTYGTASLHHIYSKKKRLDILKKSLELGITHFDTSPYYGFGLSELDLGLFLKNQRDSVTITTKIGLYAPINSSPRLPSVWTRKTIGRLIPRVTMPEINWSIDRAMSSLEGSLKRLDTDYVDFLCLHEPSLSLIDTDEFLKWFEVIKAQGKVRCIGLAGEPKSIMPWLHSNNLEFNVIQTRDGFKEEESVDLMTKTGYRPQFTYGYISSNKSQDVKTIMKKAFLRNRSGSIIISTRRKERLAGLVSLI